MQKIEEDTPKKSEPEKKLSEKKNEVKVVRVDKYFMFKLEDESVEINLELMNEMAEKFLKL